jgi:nitrogen fixation/metabolism regulation signal transduction histidine kinase
VLTDVAAALREEERSAWQRLIRVMGHEINNSLTPIKSIAGSLRSRVGHGEGTSTDDFARGLSVIEDRAASLNRFLQAYQRLSRLPQPRLAETDLREVLERVAHLETRLPVHVAGGPPLKLLADADQLQQMLINLVQNAADAALSSETADHAPAVEISLSTTSSQVVVSICDNGPGLMNPANLFVPFYTTKPTGTGVGLVLAQQIAVGHRGSVRLANRTDASGCKAEVRLPLLRVR